MNAWKFRGNITEDARWWVNFGLVILSARTACMQMAVAVTEVGAVLKRYGSSPTCQPPPGRTPAELGHVPGQARRDPALLNRQPPPEPSTPVARGPDVGQSGGSAGRVTVWTFRGGSIRDFFGQLDQAWLRKFIEHRIADRRFLRLIDKWLAAGVVEDGIWSQTVQGWAQGASASPLLANVYLHYVFDLWVDWWRGHEARGDVIVVRFADDGVPRTLREVPV